MAAPASVDEYLAGLPVDRRGALEELRDTIRAAAPDAEECVAYGMPAFRLHGRFLVSYQAFRNHTGLFPASLRVREALGPDVAPYLHGKGTLRFPAAEPIPLSLVTWLVHVRLAEVAAAAEADDAPGRPRRARRTPGGPAPARRPGAPRP